MTTEREMLDVLRDYVEEDKAKQGNGHGHDEPPLPYVDLAADLKPREWLVPERIPMRNVSMLGGEGSIGKSLLLMQLSGAVVLGKDWISTLPEPGPVLYMSCEEDDDEVRRRMEDVARHLGSTRQDMIAHGLRVLSFAGRDAILAQPDRNGIMRPTPLFESLRRDALALHPKLIVLDTVADIFGGKEIDRAQTRQFITMLRGLAIEIGAAVVIAAHPSLTGIATDTGLSGSTGWHNSVRARMYFKPAPGDDTSLRVLETKKSNYGPVTDAVLLRWRDGVYIVEPGKGMLERLAAEAEVDHLFIKFLRRFADQGRHVSDKKSPTHAPTLFADEPEAKEAKATKKAFAEAMARLFAANKLRVVTIGPISKQRSHIAEVGRWMEQKLGSNGNDQSATIIPLPTPIPTIQDSWKPVGTTEISAQPCPPPATSAQDVGANPPSNTPSNTLPTVFQRGASNTPRTPHPVGRGQLGAGCAPPPSNWGHGGGPLASVLCGWAEVFGFGGLVTVPLLVKSLMLMNPNDWPDHPGLQAMQSALRAVAESEPGTIDSAKLEQWLRENSGIEVGHLTLREAGTDKDGLAQWTLEPRVEPDKGSPSL
jgi:RecA-family ATPase